jgi:GNAT superfamily N-acetyltransferase
MNDNIIVRPYKGTDRREILRISADTAVFGEPVEAILEDRKVFCDAFTSYYTDFESEYIWVVCANNHVVGYLTGCIDTITQRRRWIKQIFPSLLFNIAQGRYSLGGKTWRFTLSMFGGVLRGEYPSVDYREYPAHLHINVEAAMRSQGFGRRLMEAYLTQLTRLGVKGVHLSTTDLNEVACRLYESIGFVLLDRRTTKVWRDIINQPIKNLIYGLILTDSAN